MLQWHKAARNAPGYDAPYSTPTESKLALLLESIPHTIQGLDNIEVVIHDLKFLAKALDVAVDRPVIDIDLIVIGRIHERVAAFNNTWPLRQRLQNEKLRHCERDLLPVPNASVPLWIELELAALNDLG
jgi:hypothetical protein